MNAGDFPATARVTAMVMGLVIMSSSPALCGPQEDGNAGLEAMKASQYDSAIKLFTRAINSRALQGDDLEFAYYQRGLAYLYKRNFKTAKEDLQRATTLKPNDFDAKDALDLAQQGRSPEDQTTAEQAAPPPAPPIPPPLPRRPVAPPAPPTSSSSSATSSASSVGRGLMGLIGKSIAHQMCQAAGMTDPSVCDAVASGATANPSQPAAPPSEPRPHTASEDDGASGLQALGKGQYDRAIRFFSRAINAGDLVPSDAAAAYFNRAKAYIKLGQEKEALSDVNRALKLQPDDADAQTAFADLMAGHRRGEILDPPASDADCTRTYQASGKAWETRRYSISVDYPRMAPLDAFVAAFRAAGAEGWTIAAVDSDVGALTATQPIPPGARSLTMDVQIAPIATRGSRAFITVAVPPLTITPALKPEMCKFLADLAS